jgi:hypothetical protein
MLMYYICGNTDEYLSYLRTGCFKYFERGGECTEICW